jgi:hypothetical protein
VVARQIVKRVKSIEVIYWKVSDRFGRRKP